MNLPTNLVVRASLAYVAIFVVTIPIWWFALSKKLAVATNPLCAAVNSIFVQRYGYAWFTVAYMGHCFSFADAYDVVPTAVVACQGFKYLLNTFLWILVNFWFFGPLLVERLNVATGGHCGSKSPDLTDLSMHQCRADPDAIWIDGFDLLGHYYFLLTASLLLLSNRSYMPTVSERQNQGLRSRSVLSFVKMLTAWLLTVWVLEFCVTSMFFHTIGERFAGLVGIPVALIVLELNLRLFPKSDETEQET